MPTFALLKIPHHFCRKLQKNCISEESWCTYLCTVYSSKVAKPKSIIYDNPHQLLTKGFYEFPITNCEFLQNFLTNQSYIKFLKIGNSGLEIRVEKWKDFLSCLLFQTYKWLNFNFGMENFLLNSNKSNKWLLFMLDPLDDFFFFLKPDFILLLFRQGS